MQSSTTQAIKTSAAPAPVGPYNQAIRAGDYLFCSGQIALDPSTNLMTGEGDIEAETKQVINNLIAVINAAGASPSQIVKTTIFLVDLKDFQKVNQLYSEMFEGCTSPARACVEVSSLPKGARVEIDCIAWIN